MKNINKIAIAAVAVVGAWMASASAQSTTEVTVNLLSQLSRENTGGDFTFDISFGSLNGGLSSLLTKDSSANGAVGFATWYSSNSRSLLSWNSVNGASIEDTDSFYRYYGDDTSVETRAGGPLTSIYSASLNNRALAFVTSSTGGIVQEVGLYDFGFDWGNPTDTAAFPVGVYDIFTLASNTVTAIYGSTNGSLGDNGTVLTSTVPEPSSMSLMLLGATALVALRRLRKNV
jgi:hypothetical protein